MSIITEANPDDEIRMGLLCPALKYHGLCSIPACADTVRGVCTLTASPYAAFCKIPRSHPVSQQQRAMLTRDPAAPLN